MLIMMSCAVVRGNQRIVRCRNLADKPQGPLKALPNPKPLPSVHKPCMEPVMGACLHRALFPCLIALSAFQLQFFGEWTMNILEACACKFVKGLHSPGHRELLPRFRRACHYPMHCAFTGGNVGQILSLASYNEGLSFARKSSATSHMPVPRVSNR